MPYIEKEDRKSLDDQIEKMASLIKSLSFEKNGENDFKHMLGLINYSFSRILMVSMESVSYSKIAMATGVVENVKQELYRRVAARYEDKKINSNGDLKEYKE